MGQAERNANDGISFVQVAEGGLSEIGNIMIRMRELAIQSASDTIGDKERSFIDQEVQSYVGEIDRIANVTKFNGTPLLNGEKDELQFQVGIRKDDADTIKFATSDYDVKSDSLGIDGMSYKTIDDSREAIDKVDEGISKVLSPRPSRCDAKQLHSRSPTLGS